MKRILAVLALVLGLCAPVAAQQTVSTYQGTMTLAANTSTPLIAANVTMAPNSGALPVNWSGQTLTVVNTGTTNSLYVCWSGGTASASSGCEPLLPGGGNDTVTIYGPGPPTLFSTAGTTVSYRQGV